MRLFTGLDALAPALLRRPVVTVGMFDGLHRGHLHVLAHLRAMADRLGGEAVVITFDTHPLAVIAGAPPRRILSPAHRLRLLARHGVDATVLLPFDVALRDLSYEAFVTDVLVARMGVRGLLFGYNGNFGRGGAGTRASVEPLGRRHGFEVAEAPMVALDAQPISSSRIRDAIEQGHLEAAAEMLGRPVALYGVVVRGEGRGRALGIPTANVDLEGELLPPRGVYAVVAEVRGVRHAAVANVGWKPTFRASAPPPGGAAAPAAPGPAPGPVDGPEGALVLEVHIPHLDADLYGERIEVELVARLREERRFPSVAALVAQIRADIASAADAVASAGALRPRAAAPPSGPAARPAPGPARGA